MGEEPPLIYYVVVSATISLIGMTVGMLLLGVDVRMAIGLGLGTTLIGAVVGWFWAHSTDGR
jgi:hypothetical protein